jgi:hypothetical protein
MLQPETIFCVQNVFSGKRFPLPPNPALDRLLLSTLYLPASQQDTSQKGSHNYAGIFIAAGELLKY